jgi:hypothetical protein
MLRDTGGIIKHPQKLKWALISRDRFEKLVGRLRELIDYLHELMDDAQMEVIHKTTQKTYLETLQLRSTVDELRELMEAVQRLQTAQHPQKFELNMQVIVQHDLRQHEKEELLQLAAFRASSFAVSENTTRWRVSTTEIPNSTISFEGSETIGGRTAAIYHLGGTPKRVWVEWKEFQSPHRGRYV